MHAESSVGGFERQIRGEGGRSGCRMWPHLAEHEGHHDVFLVESAACLGEAPIAHHQPHPHPAHMHAQSNTTTQGKTMPLPSGAYKASTMLKCRLTRWCLRGLGLPGRARWANGSGPPSRPPHCTGAARPQDRPRTNQSHSQRLHLTLGSYMTST